MCDNDWIYLNFREVFMGNKIVTEADRKRTPRPVAPKGVTISTRSSKHVSKERGAHTHHKKNPGKRHR